MGLKLRGAFRCGTCGKPRGITHTCVTSATSKRRRSRTRAQSPVTWECSSCGRVRGLRHSCGNRGDFRKRKRKAATEERQRKRKAGTARRAARRKQAAAERRARDKARRSAAGKKPRPARPRGDSHEPGTCGDKDCPRFGCKSYWQGMADCPGPHCEGGHG